MNVSLKTLKRCVDNGVIFKLELGQRIILSYYDLITDQYIAEEITTKELKSIIKAYNRGNNEY